MTKHTAALVALTMFAAACSPSAGAEPTGEFATVTERADRAWAEFTSVIDTTGMATRHSQPPVAEVMVVGSTSTGYLAAGQVNGGFAVWRSDDFASFDPLYNEICCDRHIRPQVIGEFGSALLVGGSGEVVTSTGSRTERAFLLRSDDGGRTWASIEHSVFSERATRIDSIDKVGDTLIVGAIDDECCAQPESLAVRTTDLSTFTPLVLPGLAADDWPYFQSDAEQIIAVSTRYSGPDGIGSKYVLWRSIDEGRTFSALPDATLDGGSPALIAGKLVQVPSQYQDTSRHVDAVGIRVAEPGESFVQYPPDVGQWGDGRTGLGRVSEGPTGSYAVAGRELRASPHYCYDDVNSCQRFESALVVTENGVDWFEVAGIGPDSLRDKEVDARADGSIFVWTVSGNERSVSGFRWIGPEAPRRLDPAGYPPPDIPLPLYELGDPFPVGATKRYVFGTGFCGGMHVDGQAWEPTTAFPDPVPSSWPFQRVQIADGPEGYVFGRIERVAVDEISFSIEGIGDVATFTPAPPRTEFCG